jgi:hypothetical protein
VIEMNFAFEAELGRLSGEPCDRNTIAEGIMKPPELGGMGLNTQSSINQALIVAVPRAEHHPMFTERNGLLVPIRGDMTHGENCHSTCGAAPLRRLLEQKVCRRPDVRTSRPRARTESLPLNPAISVREVDL